MEPTGERKEKDTLLEMGTFNCVNDTPNTGQAKRMQTDGSTSSDTKTPDVADDNENTSTIENEIIDDDDSSSSSSDEDEQSHVLDPNSFKGKIAILMKSNVMQYFVIAMVIIDCLIIVLELLIDMDFIKIPEDDQTAAYQTTTAPHLDVYTSTNNTSQHTDHESHTSHEVYNSSHHDNSSSHHHETHHHHSNKAKAEHILHALSLTILSLFMIEVSLKIYVEGRHLLKQKAEVFDAVVVIVSFTLDIVFSFVSVESAAKDAAGLMVLLRLWRVTRIINGVILSVKMEAKKKSDALKKIIRQLEHENRKQRSRLEKLEKENTLLRQQLVELNGGSTAVLRALIKVSHGLHHHHHHSHQHDQKNNNHKDSHGHEKDSHKDSHGYKKDNHKDSLGHEKDSDKDSHDHKKDNHKDSHGHEKDSHKDSYGHKKDGHKDDPETDSHTTLEDLEKQSLRDSHNDEKVSHKYYFLGKKRNGHKDDKDKH